MSQTMLLSLTPCLTCAARSTPSTSARQSAQPTPFCRLSALRLPWPNGQLTASSTQCSAFGFKFGKNGLGSEDAGVYGSQGRDDYTYDDVEQYFNYMGMLADVGSYDIINELNASGLAPVDILLIMAAGENDTPKVAELLRAGADATVKDPKSGKLPVELATTDAVLELLREPSKVK